jgi:hypothetical protein
MIEIVRTFSNVKKLEDYIRWLQDNSRTPDEFYGKLEKLAGCKVNGIEGTYDYGDLCELA